MTKTTETPQDQALSTALDELDQWFGLAGVAMDNAVDQDVSLNPETANTSTSTTSTSNPATSKNDISITDTNELLLDAIDQELDLWDDEPESADEFDDDPDSETIHSGEPSEDAEATESAHDPAHDSAHDPVHDSAHDAVVESASAVESANFEEVLAWATVSTSAIPKTVPKTIPKPPMPKEDSGVDPFVAVMEEALQDGSLHDAARDEAREPAEALPEGLATEILTNAPTASEAGHADDDTAVPQELPPELAELEDSLTQATLTFIQNHPLEDLLDGQPVSNESEVTETTPLTGEDLLEEALSRSAIAPEAEAAIADILGQPNQPQAPSPASSEADPADIEAIFAGAIAQATAQALAHSEMVVAPSEIHSGEEAIAVIEPDTSEQTEAEAEAETEDEAIATAETAIEVAEAETVEPVVEPISEAEQAAEAIASEIIHADAVDASDTADADETDTAETTEETEPDFTQEESLADAETVIEEVVEEETSTEDVAAADEVEDTEAGAESDAASTDQAADPAEETVEQTEDAIAPGDIATEEIVPPETIPQDPVADSPEAEVTEPEVTEPEAAESEATEEATDPETEVTEDITSEPPVTEEPTSEAPTSETPPAEDEAPAIADEAPADSAIESDNSEGEETTTAEESPETDQTPEADAPERPTAPPQEEQDPTPDETESPEAEAPATESPDAEPAPDTIDIPVVPAPEPSALLTYSGPEEVLIKTAVTLDGTYDPAYVATVKASAEDKYSFAVSLDPASGQWRVQLNEGFYQAGARWIRIQALNDEGRVIASQIVNLIVSANPLSVGQALKLTVQRDTFFKEIPSDSQEIQKSSLKKLAITRVPAGSSFTVRRYGYADGYVLVELDEALGSVGTTGYFYASHIELRKGQQLLAFDIGQVPVIVPGNGQVLITQDTLLKQKPLDSSDLSETQIHELSQGEHFEITGYACIRGHFRVTLQAEIPGFGKTGYLYFNHAQLKRDEQIVEFDPDALLLSVLENTTLKKRPVNTSNLEDDEKVSLARGQVYGVLHYEPAEDGHIAVTFSDRIPKLGHRGYLSPSDIQLNRGPQVIQTLTSQVELNVPYFGQRDNEFRPRSTCNVTAMAMVMHYYGLRSKWGQLEDELYQWCVNNHGEDAHMENVVLVRMARAYGFDATFATDRTWEDIHSRLRKKQPVVVGGYFTAESHILTIIGFNSKGYIVNDPWGDAMTGYRSGYGRKLFYPKAYMDKMCSPEGEGHIWAHFVEPKAL